MVTTDYTTQSGTLDAVADLSKRSESRLQIFDSIASTTLFVIGLTALQRIVGFGRGILFCRLLTDHELGQWSLVWSYLMLLAPIVALGLPGCFGKFTEHYAKQGNLAAFTRRIVTISFVSAISIASLLFAFSEFFAVLMFRDRELAPLVQLFTVTLVLVSTSGCLIALIESLRQVRTVTWMRFVTGVVFAILGTTMIHFWEDGSQALTLAFAVSALAGALPAIGYLYHYRHMFHDSGRDLSFNGMWMRIAPFAAWILCSDFFHSLFETTDRYMLVHFSGVSSEAALSSVGQYHAGRVVPMAVVSIASLLAGLLLPFLSKAWESNDATNLKHMVSSSIKIVAVGMTSLGCFVLILSQPLFGGLLQGRYDAGLAVLPMTMVYCIWTGIFLIGQTRLWVAEKGKLVVLILGLGVLANVLLNLFLIPRLGLPGAVRATFLANLLVMGWVLMAIQRFDEKPDHRIWFAALIPVVLLVKTPFVVATTIGLLCACCFTTVVFSRQEKRLITRCFQRGQMA